MATCRIKEIEKSTSSQINNPSHTQPTILTLYKKFPSVISSHQAINNFLLI
eukprot:c35681_g1_i1 orf=50-202(+)